MSGLVLMLKREWAHVAGSDRAQFALYGFLVVLWSLLFTTSAAEETPGAYLVWLVTFSVVVVSNFAAASFMQERMNGTLEILLTCGIARPVIFTAKTLFVTLMSAALGGICICLSVAWARWAPATFGTAAQIPTGLAGIGFVVFCAACLLNASAAAFFSVLLPNPRFVFLLNFLLSSVVVILYLLIAAAGYDSALLLLIMLLVPAAIFLEAGRRCYNGERVIRPISL